MSFRPTRLRKGSSTLVRELNADPLIHGILVQSLRPETHNERAVVETIDPKKDVDGFHPMNVAKLATDDPTGFVPCTPLGCIRLLQESRRRNNRRKRRGRRVGA